MWHDQQQQFATALLDPERLVPDTVARGPDGAPAAGFAIYRNNVMAGLSDTLTATYPVTEALVGADYFREMAKTFIRHSPPETPVLMDYGVGFADTISNFDAMKNAPYLADVARLEWAWNRSCHSADATPVPIAVLGDIPETAIEEIRLRLHPSLQLINSEWPVVSIWQAHQGENPEAALASLPHAGERAMTIRPHHDVIIRSLDEPAFAFTAAFKGGLTLGEAIALVQNTDMTDTIDPSACLAGLFETGSVIGLIPD